MSLSHWWVTRIETPVHCSQIPDGLSAELLSNESQWHDGTDGPSFCGPVFEGESIELDFRPRGSVAGELAKPLSVIARWQLEDGRAVAVGSIVDGATTCRLALDPPEPGKITLFVEPYHAV